MFDSPMTESHSPLSFNELVPRQCDVYKCFFVPPPLPPPDRTGWLEGAEVCISLLPWGRLDEAGIGYFPFPRSVRLSQSP